MRQFRRVALLHHWQLYCLQKPMIRLRCLICSSETLSSLSLRVITSLRESGRAPLLCRMCVERPSSQQTHLCCSMTSVHAGAKTNSRLGVLVIFDDNLTQVSALSRWNHAPAQCRADGLQGLRPARAVDWELPCRYATECSLLGLLLLGTHCCYASWLPCCASVTATCEG